MNFNGIPTGPHWAIIQRTTITIPGDERSRTHPGHGYPEHTEEAIYYRPFHDEAEFLAEMKKLEWRKADVIGIKVEHTYSLEVRHVINVTKT